MSLTPSIPNAFDPDGVGRRGTLFGLPFSAEEARVVILPVPWEVTVSYRAGTAGGPAAVLEASPQIDYWVPGMPEAWKTGIALLPLSAAWAARGAALRKDTATYLEWLETGERGQTDVSGFLASVDSACQALNAWTRAEADRYLEAGKRVGILGGDHSTPLGLIQALAGRYPDFGILQIDAHADLRVAYEGFRYSHASIMTNALELPQVSRLVQVGVRDQSEGEVRVVGASCGRIRQFTDECLKAERFAGRLWKDQCAEILAALPQSVYLSFDIDGLQPALCPSTGTPVPGGLQWEEAVFLINQLVASGRELIGFDLCEVAPGNDPWDAIVGARILYRLATLAGRQPVE